MDGIRVFLVDGTYELFRHHFGQPALRRRPADADGGQPRGPVSTRAATRGVLATVLSLLEEGATHLGVATDHVIESFRNDLWGGYKTSEGMPVELLSQFGQVEEALVAMGVRVWPMERLEADDALASAAAATAGEPSVKQVVVCTPDKDLAQCVRGARVVQLDRRAGLIIDEPAVEARFGVPPESIPDYLALVGDSADGYPGLPGWGAKTSAAVLRRYRHIDDIPDDAAEWDPVLRRVVRAAPRLALTLATSRSAAGLFRTLATLVVDRSLVRGVDELRWRGPTEAFPLLCSRLGADGLAVRAARLADTRQR